MTYPRGGALPQYAKYLGEYVAGDDTVQYFYRVVAYDRVSNPLTNVGDTVLPDAYGPVTLDGNHAISVNWSPVIGASFYIVYKGIGVEPPSDVTVPTDLWYAATGCETSILDVGYPCATRNAFLNPGLSPTFPAGCCGPGVPPEDTNVPPVGMAQPDDGHEGGGYVRMEPATAALLGGTPAGQSGDIQFNDNGRFGADPNLYWDIVNQKMGVHNRTPQFTLDVNT